MKDPDVTPAKAGAQSLPSSPAAAGGGSSGWPFVPLAEVLVPVERPEAPSPGTIYRQLGVQLWGKGAYERESLDGSQTKYKTLSRVEADDVVVNKIWARNGSVAVVPKNLSGCYVSGEFPTFTPNRQKLDPRWIHWLTKTKSLWEQCDEKSRGTSGKNRIRPEQFLSVCIPLPPLPEQRRIVDWIEKVARKLKETNDLHHKAKIEADALIKSVLRNLSATMKVSGSLGDILLSSPRNGWSARCDNADNGIPVLSLSAVTGFRYRSKEHKRTSLNTDPGAHYWLNPGDLLITRSNTPELVGHASIYDGHPAPCIYPDLMMRLEVDHGKADPKFIWYWLQSPIARGFIGERAKGTSPTMKKISQGIVAAIPFPIDISREKQRQIVDELSAIQTKADQLKSFHNETSAELDALTPSILDKAFKGEL